MPFRTAADIINWNLTCKSIFNRKRPLAEKTMQRIANGINKYVINNKKPFIVPDEKTTPFITECANGSSQRNMSADEPLRTICAGGLHIGEVRAFLIQYYGNSTSNNLNKPLGTVTSKDRFGLVTIACEDYQIIDIGLRMLSPAELFAAQGFSKDYIIDMDSKGNKLTITNQVARCGNAVCPPVAKALVEANFYINKQLKIA
jgi:DNA (cytosine-5)-methyltransferase 1